MKFTVPIPGNPGEQAEYEDDHGRKFDVGRAANWRDSLDEQGRPTHAPEWSEYGCQYCHGPLDATDLPGSLYRCPWCTARFPETKPPATAAEDPNGLYEEGVVLLRAARNLFEAVWQRQPDGDGLKHSAGVVFDRIDKTIDIATEGE